ncbi:MAG: hypothetical protein ACLFTH_01850 [Candidatus Woesearchaeota archaeon]
MGFVKYKLNKYFTRKIKKLSFFSFEDFARENHKPLNRLYERNVLRDASLEIALEHTIYLQAEMDYNTIVSKKKYYTIDAETLLRPECLAFGIYNGSLCVSQINEIKDSFSTSKDQFVKEYLHTDYPVQLKKELLNPSPSKDYEIDFNLPGMDPHPA